MKLLTIIISQYSETESSISRLLLSINNQVGISLSNIYVKIVGHGGYRLSERFLRSFTDLNIDYIYYTDLKDEKFEINLINNLSESKYITYMDANDELNTINSLWKFVNCIRNNGDHDIILSRYVKEDKLGKFNISKYKSSSCYGKWIRLSYIKENIKYFYELLSNDYNIHLFMDLLFYFSDDNIYIDSPTYTNIFYKNINSSIPGVFVQNIFLFNIYLFISNKRINNYAKEKSKIVLKNYLYNNKNNINLNYSKDYINSLNQNFNINGYNRFLKNNLKKIENIKLLSIIIPFYGDNIEKIYPLLCSIEYQVGIDLQNIELLIIKDGDEPISNNLSKKFNNLNIKLLHSKENIGPGPARNIGINSAKGKFIMFCDSDDNLAKPTSLFTMKKLALENPNSQVIMGKYNNEQLDDSGNHYLATWDYNYGATYPNWYRLSYLNDYNIRFHPNLHSYYEDTYFVGLACNISSNMEFTDEIIYTHRYNKNSLIHLRDKRKLYSRFLIEYCRENYYWFKAIKIHLPSNIVADINNFVLTLYKMYKEYDLNSELVDNEMLTITKKIVYENSHYWNGWTNELQSNLDDIPKDNSFTLKQFIRKFM